MKSPEPPKAPEPVKAPEPSKPTPKPESKPDPKPVEDAKSGADSGKDKGSSGGADAGKSASLIGKALTSVGGDAHDKHGKASKSEPTTAEAIAERAENRRGRQTKNDGSADEIRSGNNDGARDEKLERLNVRKHDLLNDESVAKSEIAELKAQIDSKSGVAKAMKGLASVVPGVDGKDAAKVASTLGLGDDRSELTEATKDLAGIQDDVAATNDAIETQRNLNMFADLAHMTSMPKPVVDTLEGEAGPDIDVVDETGLDSDAAYDSRTDEIEVTDEVMDEATRIRRRLTAQGAMDADGNIIRPNAVDQSGAADQAISSAALIGVHEPTHAAQHDGDEAMTEYEAYVNQETIELQSGKRKAGFLTIRADGSLLPPDQARANLAAFQGGTALPYGPSAGEAFGSGVSSGDEDAPGRKPPGRKPPGEDAPGRKPPGEDAPGRKPPGDGAP